MPRRDTVRIALPPEVAGEVRAVIASGEYASAGEVVREALRDWKLRRRLDALDLEELRWLAEHGNGCGPAADGETAFARLRALYETMARRRGA